MLPVPQAVLVALTLLVAPSGGKPSSPGWSGTSGTVHLALGPHELRASVDGKQTYGLCTPDDRSGGDCDVDATYQFESLVGPFLGYREIQSEYCGGAHSYGSTAMGTIDLRTGRQVALTALFPEDVVYAALLADPFVQKKRHEFPDAPVPSDAKGMIAWIAQLSGGDSDLQAWSLYGVEGDRALVRINLDRRQERTELGLALPIPPGLRADLEAATRASAGFLHLNAPKTQLACERPMTKQPE